MKLLLTLFGVVVTLISCTHQQKPAPTQAQIEVARPISTGAMVAKDSKKVPDAKTSPEASTDNGGVALTNINSQPKVAAKQDPDCLRMTGDVEFPYYVRPAAVIVIGFVKTCTLDDGKTGFMRGSPWVAMGFPCSRGRARIDKRGTENTPNLIGFPMQNSCPMHPSAAADAEQNVRQHLNLPQDSHLVAYYPMSVEFWEFTQYPERDVGHNPTIYSAGGLTKGWQNFSTRGDGFKVRLYGRENAWERGHILYQVEAEIKPDSRVFFRLDVHEAKALNAKELGEVRGRCEAIRPARNCADVFN